MRVFVAWYFGEVFRRFSCLSVVFFLFFFNDTATTEIYTLSLHDALPICLVGNGSNGPLHPGSCIPDKIDRKSTRLNSSHLVISYAVFCLKKKHTQHRTTKVLRDELDGRTLAATAALA